MDSYALFRCNLKNNWHTGYFSYYPSVSQNEYQLTNKLIITLCDLDYEDEGED